MKNYEKILLDLIIPLCNDKENLSVKQMDSLKENEILLFVYATNDDIGRLIGRKGMMASSIRNMMQIATKVEEKRINIKFETI